MTVVDGSSIGSRWLPFAATERRRFIATASFTLRPPNASCTSRTLEIPRSRSTSARGSVSAGTMRLTLRDSLPFATLVLVHRGQAKEVSDILVDTGSASTVIAAEVAAQIGIVPEPDDRLRALRGVGGREVVFTRRLDRVELGFAGVDDFEIEIAGMDYGFQISGILGMDFLRATRSILDLDQLEIRFAT